MALDSIIKVLQIQPIGVPETVRLSQNENGRALIFRLVGNEEAIPNDATVTISGTKPDGVVYSAIGSISSDVVTFAEDTQMTAAAGVWDAKIQITKDGETVATARIRFVIDADPVAPGSVPSDSQLEGLVAQAQDYATIARGAAYGSPFTASTAAAMTDHDRVYVYTGSETGYTSGNWYYWNGTAWASGGVYNSQGLQTDPSLTVSGMAADAKATGDAVTHLEGEISAIDPGLSDDAVTALLTCFQKVAWIDDNGQTYYSALENALMNNSFPKITATLNLHGHEVFKSDTVDSLKDYLTVKYYETYESAGDTVASADYTLSGVLAGGTSYITATYNNLMTTFSVPTVNVSLGSGYTRKDYIKVKFTGSAHNTDVTAAGGLSVDFGTNLNSLSFETDIYPEQRYGSISGVALFGGRVASGSGSSVALYLIHSAYALGGHVHGTDIDAASLMANTITFGALNHIKLINPSASPSVLSAPSKSINVAWTNSNNVNSPLWYFTNKNTQDSPTSAIYASTYIRLGNILVSNTSGEMVHYLIPCFRTSDNVIGIYDAVTGTFSTTPTASYATIGNTNCKYEVGMWS